MNSETAWPPGNAVRTALLLALMSAAACSPPPEPPPPAGVARPQHLRQVSRVRLAGAPDASAMRFRLAAPPEHSLYLDHCNGAFSWGLEHQVAGSWKPAWTATIDGCHSAPIRIPAGSFREFRERVALDPGTHLPAGGYRLAVHGLYSRHDADDQAATAEVPHGERVSEPFAFGPLDGR